MTTILEKFKYWDNKIAEQENKLFYILTKIINSVKLSFQLLDSEGTKIEEKTDLVVLLKEFDVSESFSKMLDLFHKIYEKLIEIDFFNLDVKNIETLERIRKTQYHIWNLFEHSQEYNLLVRKYNDRIDMPKRFLVAKIYGFKKRRFVLDLFDKNNMRIFGIAGPSASGKGTVSKFIRNQYNVSYIEMDVFFKKSTRQKYAGYDNWEHKNSLMFDELYKCLLQLKNGEPTLIPSKGWTEEFDKLIYPKDIILIEGFLLFLDKRVRKLLDKKIFVDLDEENQLVRRMKRDGEHSMDYIRKVVIPHYRKYKREIVSNSDLVVDGNKSKQEVLIEVKHYLKL